MAAGTRKWFPRCDVPGSLPGCTLYSAQCGVPGSLWCTHYGVAESLVWCTLVTGVYSYTVWGTRKTGVYTVWCTYCGVQGKLWCAQCVVQLWGTVQGWLWCSRVYSGVHSVVYPGHWGVHTSQCGVQYKGNCGVAGSQGCSLCCVPGSMHRPEL